MSQPKLIDEPNILILKQENQSGHEYSWQKKVRSIFKKERFLEFRDLNRLQAGYFLNYKCMKDLYTSCLPQYLKGAFLSSDMDPYADEQYEDTDDLVVKLRGLGIPSYRIQASGHAKPHDIYKFVREINPRYLFPVHTTYPKMFETLFRNTGIKVILKQNATKPSEEFLEAE